MNKPCYSTFHNAPQGEILSAVYQHPVVNGVPEEIRTEANQEYHDNTAQGRAYDTASDTAGCIADDGCTAYFKEAGEGQRDDNRREHPCRQDNGYGGGNHCHDKPDNQRVGRKIKR